MENKSTIETYEDKKAKNHPNFAINPSPAETPAI